MANAEAELEDGSKPAKGGLKGLLIGALLALLLGGAGFYAVWSGLILAPPPVAEDSAMDMPTLPNPVLDIAFIPIEPMLISLSPESASKHLRFRGQLEVDIVNQERVTMLMPRVVDVLNNYLRAVDPSELESPGALTRLRAQMLRRVQVVIGDNMVRDLLIMEFILN